MIGLECCSSWAVWQVVPRWVRQKPRVNAQANIDKKWSRRRAAFWHLLLNAPRVLKPTDLLARINTTSSDIFCSEEDSCGEVIYVKLIANNNCTTHDYWLLYEDVEFMAQWFTSTIWGEGNCGKFQLWNSIKLIPAFIAYIYGTLHFNYNGHIFSFEKSVIQE
jgi:hypothetical protein